jgi:hypothetical protein
VVDTGKRGAAAAPQHHTLLFENDEVRVLTVTIPPGVKEPFPAHRYASVIDDEQPSHLIEYVLWLRRVAALNEAGNCFSGPRRIVLLDR